MPVGGADLRPVTEHVSLTDPGQTQFISQMSLRLANSNNLASTNVLSLAKCPPRNWPDRVRRFRLSGVLYTSPAHPPNRS